MYYVYLCVIRNTLSKVIVFEEVSKRQGGQGRSFGVDYKEFIKIQSHTLLRLSLLFYVYVYFDLNFFLLLPHGLCQIWLTIFYSYKTNQINPVNKSPQLPLNFGIIYKQRSTKYSICINLIHLLSFLFRFQKVMINDL